MPLSCLQKKKHFKVEIKLHRMGYISISVLVIVMRSVLVSTPFHRPFHKLGPQLFPAVLGLHFCEPAPVALPLPLPLPIQPFFAPVA